jgi:hypothetical protein
LSQYNSLLELPLEVRMIIYGNVMYLERELAMAGVDEHHLLVGDRMKLESTSQMSERSIHLNARAGRGIQIEYVENVL